jgi:hypothetical protein
VRDGSIVWCLLAALANPDSTRQRASARPPPAGRGFENSSMLYTLLHVTQYTAHIDRICVTWMYNASLASEL